MRETRKSGSVGAPGWQRPGATRSWADVVMAKSGDGQCGPLRAGAVTFGTTLLLTNERCAPARRRAKGLPRRQLHDGTLRSDRDVVCRALALTRCSLRRRCFRAAAARKLEGREQECSETSHCERAFSTLAHGSTNSAGARVA